MEHAPKLPSDSPLWPTNDSWGIKKIILISPAQKVGQCHARPFSLGLFNFRVAPTTFLVQKSPENEVHFVPKKTKNDQKMKRAKQVFPCEFVEKFGTRATKKRKRIEDHRRGRGNVNSSNLPDQTSTSRFRVALHDA